MTEMKNKLTSFSLPRAELLLLLVAFLSILKTPVLYRFAVYSQCLTLCQELSLSSELSALLIRPQHLAR